MARGLIGFLSSMARCGLTLWAGLAGWLAAGATFVVFALFRSLYGALGSAAPPAVQAYIAARTDHEERTQALSLDSSSFGLATVHGPPVAPRSEERRCGKSGCSTFYLRWSQSNEQNKIYLPR